MPLWQTGLAHFGSNLDWQTREKIVQVFRLIDKEVEELTRARGVHPSRVRLRRPLHRCVLVGDEEVFVALSVHDIGVTTIEQLQDWAGKGPMNLTTAVHLVERDLQFSDGFGFSFGRSTLELDGAELQEEAVRIAGHLWEDEVTYMEKLNKIVKIVPLSANVRETRSTQRIRVGRRQRKRTCWDCEREWKRMVVPLEPGRPSEARQLLRTRR